MPAARARYKYDNARAAYVYLVMASFGTLALLLAFGTLAGPEGAYDFAAVRAAEHSPLSAALVLALVLLGVTAVAYFGLARDGNLPRDETPETGTRNRDVPLGESRTGSSGEPVLASAFENQSSNIQIEGRGIVTRILPDDVDGSRHQRFIIELDTGQTLLMAHNIDLAPRIAALRKGDTISFYGEYEWNPEGGRHPLDASRSGRALPRRMDKT